MKYVKKENNKEILYIQNKDINFIINFFFYQKELTLNYGRYFYKRIQFYKRFGQQYRRNVRQCPEKRR